MSSHHLKYVLMTAARNEEAFLEQTIRSVVAQKALPAKWIVVSDGSTDQTDEIVGKYAAQHDWIQLLRAPEHGQHEFAAKVDCLRAAWEKLRPLQFDSIGNLDADITFEADYMSFLLEKLAGEPGLGVVGTRFTENARQVYDYKFMNEEHVSGGVQIFRRACFEEVGGYIPMRSGGEDWAAVTSARMKGWRTRSYAEKLFVHHRPMGSNSQERWSVHWRRGERDYLTGGHPLWQLSRSAYQTSKKPYIVGGLFLLFGFAWAFLRRMERPVPEELMHFHRSEQMARLRRLLPLASKRVLPDLPQRSTSIPLGCRGLESTSQTVRTEEANFSATMAASDWALVTGAGGFIGVKVVESLLKRGWKKIRCLVRPSSDTASLKLLLEQYPAAQVQIISGNLLSREHCAAATRDARIVFHLVTGRGKSFPGCYQNSVVTTRNLLDALVAERAVVRLVNVSTFAVHSNMNLKPGGMLDESCEIEPNLEERYDAYVYAKLKQDELVADYHRQHGLPCVTVRPGIVFGRGKKTIPGAVGIDTFGFFLHLGGGNRLPLTYVDNCADAIVLAGLVKGVEGQIFNVVDDDLPTSRSFLRQYKQEVRNFRSVAVPYSMFYLFCHLWERYAKTSQGQLPPVFNRRACAFMWKRHRFSNQKLKDKLGWKPAIPMADALQRYFAYQRHGVSLA